MLILARHDGRHRCFHAEDQFENEGRMEKRIKSCNMWERAARGRFTRIEADVAGSESGKVAVRDKSLPQKTRTAHYGVEAAGKTQNMPWVPTSSAWRTVPFNCAQLCASPCIPVLSLTMACFFWHMSPLGVDDSVVGLCKVRNEPAW